MGFVLTPEEADAMLAADPRNADVIRRYLDGEDLNQRPDGSPSRWVIDFRDWTEERARQYPEPLRSVSSSSCGQSAASRTSEAIASAGGSSGRQARSSTRRLRGSIAASRSRRVSKAVQPMFVPAGIVYVRSDGRLCVRRRRPLRLAGERIPLVVGRDTRIDDANATSATRRPIASRPFPSRT